MSIEERSFQNHLRRKNLKSEIESRRHKIEVAERITRQRKYGVAEMKLERNVLSDIVINEREREFVEKKTRHEIIKQMQEEARRRREFERKEIERKRRESLLRKAQEEEIEARKAEQIIKLLEMKEREWIHKLKEAQRVQEDTIREIENAVIGEINEESLNLISRQGITKSARGTGTADGNQLSDKANPDSSRSKI